ncbi:MAG: hypothetical protein ACPG32_06215 [Akkermansiaceae bacterium]
MRKIAKTKWISFFAMAALTLPGLALEKRKFHNADKSKSFSATLTAYNPTKKTVTVQFKSGKSSTFSIEKLSADDQKYVKDNADVLAVSSNLIISFKEVKDKTQRTKSDRVRTATTPTAFDIKVYNRSDTPIENLEIRYSYYYCVGSSSASGPRHTPKVSKGTLTFPKMFGKYTETRTTEKVALIRESKQGKAPPVPSGGGGGGGG